MRDVFKFAWNVDTRLCVPGFGASNYETAMFFYSQYQPLVYGSSPRDEILKDRNLQPRSNIVFVDMTDEAEKQIEGNDRKMWRYCSLGYLSNNFQTKKGSVASPPINDAWAEHKRRRDEKPQRNQEEELKHVWRKQQKTEGLRQTQMNEAYKCGDHEVIEKKKVDLRRQKLAQSQETEKNVDRTKNKE